MDKVKGLAASWARSFLAAALALGATGQTDWRVLGYAGLAALCPVVLRAVNPNDALGRKIK